ncbi:MAG: tetratricopeptide repeat protein [Kofleriaceae bacterium]
MRRSPWFGRSLLAAALVVAAVTPALAQGDDWSVTRDPFDKGVIARLKGILARNPSDADALAKLLTMYRRYRTVALLRSEYDAALAKQPDDFATLVVIGRLAKADNDAATALAMFERAGAARTDAAVAVELGTLYRQSGRLPEARAALDRAVAAKPPKAILARALRALADLALAAKDVDGARGYFEQYIALEPGNVALRLELGDALAGAGKHDDAIAVYQDAERRLGSDPARRVEVVARIGAALEGKGADADAVTTYRRAIKLVPRGYYLETELTARIVDIYRRKQDLGTLVAYYEREWPEGKRGAFEWSTLARLYEETGEQDQALGAYRKAVAKAPYELELQRRLIQLYEATGRDAEALAQYEVVVKVAPGDARFQLELAERLWKAPAEAKALALAKKIEGRFPSDPAVTSAIADLYLRWNKEDLALAALERVAKLEPEDPDNLVTLGEQYSQRGQVDKAMATWRRIAAVKSAAAYARLGDVLAEHDAATEGLAYYAKALKLEPDNADLYKGRAQIFERAKAYAEAVADWQKALALYVKPSERAARREARTRIVNLLPRWDGGAHKEPFRRQWELAFAASGADVDAGYFLVAFYQRFAQGGQPRKTLERLRTLVPDDQEVMLDLVKVYRAEAAFDRAVALLLKLAELDPARQREAYSQIAEIKTQTHQDAEAIAWSQKALEKSPNDPVAYQRLAERYVEMQRLDEAIAAYRRAIELAPRSWPLYFAQAELHQQRLEHDDAAALYRQVLRQATDDDTLIKAGRADIALEEINQSMGELEKVLAPLSSIMGHKLVYRQLLVELYLRYVPRLVARTRTGSAEVRAGARAELDRLGRGGMKALLDALADEALPGQRAIAVDVLGHLGNPAAALPLVRVARQEPTLDPDAPRAPGLDLAQRIEALVAAGRLGDPRIVPDVLPLARHPEVGLREAAVFALAHVSDQRATAALIDALDDRRPSVAALACLGLAASSDPRARQAAMAIDAARPDLVRAACAAGLAGAGKAALPSLVAAVEDNAGEAQRLAAFALGQVGDPRAGDALVRAYLARGAATSTGRDRATLVWALARLGGAPPAPPLALDHYPTSAGKLDLTALIEALPGPLPDVVPNADVLIGREDAAAKAIVAGLGAHRDQALAVLRDLDARGDGLGLGQLTAGPLSTGARAALVTIGDRIRDAVVAKLADPDDAVAARAVRVAGKLGGAALAALAPALSDPRPLVRSAATAAIAAAGAEVPATLVAALAARLDAADWNDRAAAATAMAALGPRADRAALTKAAADASAYVRTAAVVGLAARADAVDDLVAASRDPVREVRAAAARGLVGRTEPAARARLAELAADPDPMVAGAAAGSP